MTAPAQPVQRALPAHLSYSQVNSFNECGERFRLERLFGIKGPPSWASVGGTAFHAATEILDRFFFAQGLDSAQTRDVIFPQQVSAAGVPLTSRASAETPGSGDYEANVLDTLMELSELGDSTQWTIDAGKDDLPAASPPLTALWNLCLEEAIRREQSRTSEPDPKGWRASGRKSKAWPGKQDYAWWQHHGPLMVAGYVRWREQCKWDIATLERDAASIPAIELDVSGLIGDIPVEAHLDVVYLDVGGVPVLCDKKTSAQEPSSDEQLGLYKVLLEKMGLPPVRWGVYYVARKGQTGSLRDLSHYNERYFEYKYSSVWKRRNAGDFIPNPASPFCHDCPVKSHCWAKAGRDSALIPRPWDAAKPTIKSSNRQPDGQLNKGVTPSGTE